MSAVGSGDSSLAAWALAIIQNKSISDCLRSGVAAGTANTQEIGAGRFEKTEYLKFLNRINIS
jgi:fructose-1-phosphate kinase PfkB-like protein